MLFILNFVCLFVISQVCGCVNKIFTVDISHIKLTRDNMDATKLYAITFVYIILEYICFSQCNAFYKNWVDQANNVSSDQLMTEQQPSIRHYMLWVQLTIDDIKHWMIFFCNQCIYPIYFHTVSEFDNK